MHSRFTFVTTKKRVKYTATWFYICNDYFKAESRLKVMGGWQSKKQDKKRE